MDDIFKNHREAISAMDLFVVPTVNFTIVYVFFIIEHAQRKVLHFNVTEHPTSQWVMQQLREAFPFDSALKLLVWMLILNPFPDLWIICPLLAL